jgi:hypothetical protein
MRLAVNAESLPLAAHLTTPRFGYAHHGIYVGEGKVIHYGGCHRFVFLRGPVEEVSIEAFARGRSISVENSRSQVFPATQVVSRARSRLGENCYRLFSNNCEHFCHWCFSGKPHSGQVERWSARARRVVGLLSGSVPGQLGNYGVLVPAGRAEAATKKLESSALVDAVMVSPRWPQTSE